MKATERLLRNLKEPLPYIKREGAVALAGLILLSALIIDITLTGPKAPNRIEGGLLLLTVLLILPPWLLITYKAWFRQTRYSITDLRQYFRNHVAHIKGKKDRSLRALIFAELIWRSVCFVFFLSCAIAICYGFFSLLSGILFGKW